MIATAVDDRGVVLGDDNATCRTENLESDLIELEANLSGNDGGAGQDRDVLQHCLATIAEGRGLDGHRWEGAADAVDDESRQRLAVDVLGDDGERLASGHDLLEQGQELLNAADLVLH